jgi:Ni/Co efflux regulator RcnB
MTSRFFRPLAAGVALAVLAGPLAYAQSTNQYQQGAYPSHQEQAPQQHGPAMAPPQPQHQVQVQVQHPPQPQHETQNQYQPEHQTWQRGGHYQGQREVVQDWHTRGLHQPPHGYEWVRDGDQYVLIAIGTGIIASVIANALSH